jgi:hemoglobin
MTIFDKLGGADALHKVVDKFYELLLADAHLAPHFKGFDIAKVKQGQVEFLTEVQFFSYTDLRRTQDLSRP